MGERAWREVCWRLAVAVYLVFGTVAASSAAPASPTPKARIHPSHTHTSAPDGVIRDRMRAWVRDRRRHVIVRRRSVPKLIPKQNSIPRHGRRRHKVDLPEVARILEPVPAAHPPSARSSPNWVARGKDASPPAPAQQQTQPPACRHQEANSVATGSSDLSRAKQTHAPSPKLLGIGTETLYAFSPGACRRSPADPQPPSAPCNPTPPVSHPPRPQRQ